MGYQDVERATITFFDLFGFLILFVVALVVVSALVVFTVLYFLYQVVVETRRQLRA